MRRVRYKIIRLPSYKDRVYSVIGIYIFLGREKSVMQEEANEKCEWNQTFLKQVIKKEKQISQFMKRFYNKTMVLPHTSSHKVCTIRELNIAKTEDEEEKDDEWQNKKEEC